MGFSTSSHPAEYSLNYVWDVGTLEWVVMTQPGGGVAADVNLDEVGGVAFALGQTTMSASLPVTLASNQSTVPVGGDTASGSADTGNPVPIGLRVETTLPTAEADNDRVRIIGDTTGRVFTRTGHQGPANNYWDVQHVPAANTQATISQAAAAAGIRNVCTGFTVTLAAQTTAPAAVQLTVAVIDGATGGTTYLWRTVISLPATAGAIVSFVRSNIWLVGTAATAMTIEFSAAGGANTIESVTMEGTTVAE
jgi:hypothetical protein